jgi:hypothetical protein
LTAVTLPLELLFKTKNGLKLPVVVPQIFGYNLGDVATKDHRYI